jgi:hypothetical protein
MPYKIHYLEEEQRVPVCVRCHQKQCLHHENGDCDADWNEEELDPQDPEFCEAFDLCLCNDEVYSFKYLSDVNDFLDRCEEAEAVQRIIIDETALRLLFVEFNCKNSIHSHRALIQLSEESQKVLKFKPHVDGGVLVVPENQLSMEL